MYHLDRILRISLFVPECLFIHFNLIGHAGFCGDWSIDGDNPYRATFHLIARGNCWLHLLDANQVITLRGGDLIVFPRDIRHRISSDPLNADFPHAQHQEAHDNEAPTSVVCGFFEFESPQPNPILEALPDVIQIRNEDTEKSAVLDSVLRMIAMERGSGQPGSEAVIDKFSEVLFIQVIRTFMQQSGTKPGLLAALFHPKLSKVIHAVQEQPGYRWNVANLAETAGMSRSAFASQFLEVSSMTPMQYVTNWRMQNAFELLRSGVVRSHKLLKYPAIKPKPRSARHSSMKLVLAPVL